MCSDTQVWAWHPKFHLQQVRELSANPSQLSSNKLSIRERSCALGRNKGWVLLQGLLTWPWRSVFSSIRAQVSV